MASRSFRKYIILVCFERRTPVATISWHPGACSSFSWDAILARLIKEGHLELAQYVQGQSAGALLRSAALDGGMAIPPHPPEYGRAGSSSQALENGPGKFLEDLEKTLCPAGENAVGGSHAERAVRRHRLREIEGGHATRSSLRGSSEASVLYGGVVTGRVNVDGAQVRIPGAYVCTQNVPSNFMVEDVVLDDDVVRRYTFPYSDSSMTIDAEMHECVRACSSSEQTP